MPRLRVHYTCDHCGHQSSAEYFDYRYHETEVVQRSLRRLRLHVATHAPEPPNGSRDGDRSAEQ